LGAVEGIDPDYDDVMKNLDGAYEEDINSGRTSTTAWCVHDCYADEIAQGAIQTVTNLVDIPEENHEHLQLLKYEKGQFYKEHHDYVEAQSMRHSGVRMLTVLLFLDDVETGGETRFPMLNITVEPKQGRALYWPNVRNGAPDKKDERTIHQALPVVKGVKYAAKAWVHQRDYKTPKENGCGNVEITPP
jgi:prolyl 4-hydroxylase